MPQANHLTYAGFVPHTGDGATLLPDAMVIGRVRTGKHLQLGHCATLRGDGERIDVGDDCRFDARSTVHIADGLFPTRIGNGVTVGRFAVVHACTVGDHCVIGDAAVVMDQAELGPGVVLAANTFVPPRKRLEGGWLYAGSPAVAVRRIGKAELESLRAALVTARPDSPLCTNELPPLDNASLRAGTAGTGPLRPLGDRSPRRSPGSYVAPTAVVAGAVTMGARSSVWFGCALSAAQGQIRLGEDSNIQDNSIIEAGNGTVAIGSRVTIGHNVRMKGAVIEDDCLIGIGAVLGAGVTVEQGGCIGAASIVLPATVVEAGWIWAGRPARPFRLLKDSERAQFHDGMRAYVRYTETYGS